MTVRRKDVAALAGTSPAVVSYVLNGGPRSVAPETRERVLRAVEALDYRPNRIAQSLRTSRTQTLGLVVPDTSNPFFSELARAVEEAAFEAGYTMLLGNATEDEQRQTTYVRTFIERQVDGLVLVAAHGPAECVQELHRARTPWVALDRQIPGDLVAPQVVVDNHGGARSATAHLIAHERRRIACIAGPADVRSAIDRVAGWREAMANAGLAADEGSVFHIPFGRRAGYELARELLGSAQFDALFVASDEQALGVLRAMTQRGLRCPDDIAIVSFDGIAASAFAVPGLTTVAQPFDDLGREALARLIERIKEPGRKPTSTVLPLTLVRRGSCGCADPVDATPDRV